MCLNCCERSRLRSIGESEISSTSSLQHGGVSSAPPKRKPLLLQFTSPERSFSRKSRGGRRTPIRYPVAFLLLCSMSFKCGGISFDFDLQMPRLLRASAASSGSFTKGEKQVITKIEKPYIRLRHDGSGVYECSACPATFHGPGGRKELGTEFDNHIHDKHSPEPENRWLRGTIT
jgi:hypothetical protein